MPIPRLPEAAQAFTVEITVNTRLRPYFEIWYQRTKQDGETPEQFALRVLKTAALNDYIKSNIKTETDAIAAAKVAAETALNNDIQAMGTEVE